MTQITKPQQRSMHLWIRQWKEALDAENITVDLLMDALADRSVEVPLTEFFLKEYVWRVVQLKMTGKTSSKDISSKEVQEIALGLSKWSAQCFGVAAPSWPSQESLQEEQDGIH